MSSKQKQVKKVDFIDMKLSLLQSNNNPEDSFVDSSLSSSSSDVVTHTASSKMTVLSSVSSTSSGVGSSNVSSASSTTSETPSTEHLHTKQLNRISTVSNSTTVSSVSCSSRSKAKLAPKAIISDDGDIEVETPKHQQCFHQTTKPILHNEHRLSMRIVDAKKDANINRGYFLNQSNQQLVNKQQSKSNQFYHTSNSAHYNYQNQLAAATAAAAALAVSYYRFKLVNYSLVHALEC